MRIGVDLGGTKIEAIAIDHEGREIWRRRVATPVGDYDATLSAIAGLVAAAESDLGMFGSVGVGSPGSISPATGLLRNANSVILNGRPLDRDLERVLARPVRLRNDADCFAISEATDGAGVGARVVFGVIIGTGVGGGVVIDGHVLTGRNGIAGEWGHNPLPWPHAAEHPGPTCWCGKQGCIETYLSGPGFARDFAARTGRRLSAADIVAAAARGDVEAVDAIERYVDRLARALATVVDILDPDVIVLGGGLSNMAQIYARVPTLIGRYAFSDRIDTPVRQARHGDSSGVRGAAWAWSDSRR